MAYLPETPLTLTGGCHCSAIRYTISIPALPSRPLIPDDPPTTIPLPTGTTKAVESRFPKIELDHCYSCRRSSGALVQCWFICPQTWVTFTVLPQGSAVPISVPVLEVINPALGLRERTYIGHYESSPETHRTFCARCGTSLTYFREKERPGRPPTIDVALGTLDQESFERDGVRPDRHCWWEDGTSWVQNLLREGDGGLMIS